MKNILAISNYDDPHIEMVQDHLQQRIEIFDPSQLPDQRNITYDFADGKMRIVSIIDDTTEWIRSGSENQHT